MNSLSIDTSTELMSIALKTAKGYYTYSQKAGMGHSERLLPEIVELTKKAGISLKDLELIVVAKGPGSFTGLRMAMSTAKALAQGAEASMVSIPTLDIYGKINQYNQGYILPVIDAKKKQFFTALYKNGKILSHYMDATPQDILEQFKTTHPLFICGPHGRLFLERIGKQNLILIEDQPTALTLLEMGETHFNEQGADPVDSAPIYLRKSEAELSRST